MPLNFGQNMFGDSKVYEGSAKRQFVHNISGLFFFLDISTDVIFRYPGYSRVYSITNGSTKLFSSFVLPDNALINSANVEGSASMLNRTYTIYRMASATSTANTICSANCHTSSIANPLYAEVDNDNYIYCVEIDSIQVNDYVYAAKILYTI